MKTIRTVAKGLSVLCLLGAAGLMLILQLCGSNSSVFSNADNSNPATAKSNNKAVETSFSCKENDSVTDAPADLGVSRILTPIISEYLSDLMPRLLH